MSTNQLRGRSGSLADSGLEISFSKDWHWTVQVEPGHVRSPRNLSYPTLRLTENGTPLATVGFDSKTADLTINSSDATSRFAQSLDLLKREYQQEELVAHAILNLLQDAQARRSVG